MNYIKYIEHFIDNNLKAFKIGFDKLDDENKEIIRKKYIQYMEKINRSQEEINKKLSNI